MKKMRKLISILLLISLGLMSSPLLSLAESASFDDYSIVVPANTPFSVVVSAQDLNAIGTIDFVLQYDPDLLTYVGTVEGPLMQPTFMGVFDSVAPNGDLEELSVTISTDVEEGITGSGELATVTFTTDTELRTTDIKMISMVMYPTDFSPSPETTEAADIIINQPYGHFQVGAADIEADSGFDVTIEAGNLFTASTTDVVLFYDPAYITYVDESALIGDFSDPMDIFGIWTSTTSVGGLTRLLASVPVNYNNVEYGDLVTLSFDSNNVVGATSISLHSLTSQQGEDYSFDSIIGATSTPFFLTLNDSVLPSIEITDPELVPSYSYGSTSPAIIISGTASDNFDVSQVSFLVDTGDSGTAEGTETWTALVGLEEGENVIEFSAEDTSGNLATTSITVDFTLSASDVTAPVRSAGSPSGSLARTTTSTNIMLTTDEDAICHYSTVAGTAYAASTVFPSTGSTTHTLAINVSSGNSYNYYVRCQDIYDNANSNDYAISFSVAAASSGGGGGGGSVVTDKTPPGKVKDAKVERKDTQAVLNWTNPTDSDFSKVSIIRTETALVATTTLTNAKKIGFLVYEGNLKTFTDSGVLNEKDYNYSFYSIDKTGNASQPLMVLSPSYKKTATSTNPSSGQTTASTTTATSTSTNPGPGQAHVGSLLNATSEQVELVSRSESVKLMSNSAWVALDTSSLKVYQKVSAGRAFSSEGNKYNLAHFIQFGTDTTKHLGAGERGGVVNSYFSAFGHLPISEADWMDVIKIANGRWPTARNTNLENKNKSEVFKKIYKREANMADAKDNAAVTIITYGLRPLNRNMNSEANAIKHFKGIFGSNPSSATDWDIVRAISYSGATR